MFTLNRHRCCGSVSLIGQCISSFLWYLTICGQGDNFKNLKTLQRPYQFLRVPSNIHGQNELPDVFHMCCTVMIYQMVKLIMKTTGSAKSSGINEQIAEFIVGISQHGCFKSTQMTQDGYTEDWSSIYHQVESKSHAVFQ